MRNLQGKEFTRYGGLLGLASEKGIKRIEIEVIKIPSKPNGDYPICAAWFS